MIQIDEKSPITFGPGNFKNTFGPGDFKIRLVLVILNKDSFGPGNLK